MSKTVSPTKTAMRLAVLSIIAEHRDQAHLILRHHLVGKVAIRLGLTPLPASKVVWLDRLVRRTTEWLRANHPVGARIVSTQDKRGGYWLEEDDEEVEKHIRTEKARALTILDNIRSRERLLKFQNPDQLKLL
jgi:hypothetical protein